MWNTKTFACPTPPWCSSSKCRSLPATLDEIFKANSAILNSLSTLLNERVFHNGAKAVHTPLVAVIGASNELPEGEELDALLDRFLLRLHVGPVSGKAFPELMALSDEGDPELAANLKLTPDELSQVQAEADRVIIPDGEGCWNQVSRGADREPGRYRAGGDL